MRNNEGTVVIASVGRVEGYDVRHVLGGVYIDPNKMVLFYIYVKLKYRKRSLSRKKDHNALWH